MKCISLTWVNLCLQVMKNRKSTLHSISRSKTRRLRKGSKRPRSTLSGRLHCGWSRGSRLHHRSTVRSLLHPLWHCGSLLPQRGMLVRRSLLIAGRLGCPVILYRHRRPSLWSAPVSVSVQLTVQGALSHNGIAPLRVRTNAKSNKLNLRPQLPAQIMVSRPPLPHNLF